MYLHEFSLSSAWPIKKYQVQHNKYPLACISFEISHGMSTEESENDPLRGQRPGAEVPYREICQRAAEAAAAEAEAAEHEV